MSGDKPADGDPPGRGTAHRAARRAQMTAAALEAIRTVGPDVSMADIAAAAGVSKPIVYRQFEDKADLYAEVAQHAVGQLMGELVAELEKDRPDQEQLRAVIDVYLMFVEREPELYRFLVRRAAVEQAQARATVDHFIRAVGNRVSVLLGERLRRAGVDSGGAQAWGHGLVGLVQAAADQWLDHRSMSRADLRDYLTALLWQGFAGMIDDGPLAQAGDPSPGERPADGPQTPARLRPVRPAER